MDMITTNFGLLHYPLFLSNENGKFLVILFDRLFHCLSKRRGAKRTVLLDPFICSSSSFLVERRKKERKTNLNILQFLDQALAKMTESKRNDIFSQNLSVSLSLPLLLLLLLLPLLLLLSLLLVPSLLPFLL